MVNTDLSVVIPTRNAGTGFEEVLCGVRRQRDVTIEDLVIVDSRSTDPTREIARRFGATVLVVSPSKFNHGLTRLDAVRQTKTSLVVLMTQDAQLERADVFAGMARHFSDERVAGVYVPQVAKPGLDRIEARRWRRLAPDGRSVVVQEAPPAGYESLAPDEKARLCAFDNVCSMIRRRALDEHPFRATPFAEDRLWARDVIRAGWKIVYDGGIEVVHSHAPSMRQRLCRVFVNHRAMYRYFGYRVARDPIDFWGYTARATWTAFLEARRCGASHGRALCERCASVLDVFAALAGLLEGMRQGRLE